MEKMHQNIHLTIIYPVYGEILQFHFVNSFSVVFCMHRVCVVHHYNHLVCLLVSIYYNIVGWNMHQNKSIRTIWRAGIEAMCVCVLETYVDFICTNAKKKHVRIESFLLSVQSLRFPSTILKLRFLSCRFSGFLCISIYQEDTGLNLNV